MELQDRDRCDAQSERFFSQKPPNSAAMMELPVVSSLRRAPPSGPMQVRAIQPATLRASFLRANARVFQESADPLLPHQEKRSPIPDRSYGAAIHGLSSDRLT